DVAFETFIQQRVQALLIGPGPLFVTRMDRLVAFAARHSLPHMYSRRELVDAGGLVSYASSTAEGYRQIAIYAGRILKAEKPSELPVVQPTRFELVINLKTAKALGLEIKPTPQQSPQSWVKLRSLISSSINTNSAAKSTSVKPAQWKILAANYCSPSASTSPMMLRSKKRLRPTTSS